jgi:hypothetical protein
LSLQNPSDAVCRAAIDRDPNVAGLVPGLSEANQIYAVQKMPSVVNSLRDPSAAVVAAAVHMDGRMIRNFQNRYPALRQEAIRQNPFAISTLNKPTRDECILAMTLDPSVERFIKSRAVAAEASAELLSDSIGVEQDEERGDEGMNLD